MLLVDRYGFLRMDPLSCYNTRNLLYYYSPTEKLKYRCQPTDGGGKEELDRRKRGVCRGL